MGHRYLKMSTTTKTFKNTTKKTILVPTVGEIPAGESISLTGEFLPHVVVANYPGLVETTDDEAPTKKEASDE